MPVARRALLGLLILGLALAWAGCSVNGDSTDDAEIVEALNLKKADGRYEMNGDPFCQIDEVLNDVDEVESADDQKGVNFVIAAPGGVIGVLAHPPFAPSCKRQAIDALKRLVRPSKKSD